MCINISGKHVEIVTRSSINVFNGVQWEVPECTRGQVENENH